MKERARAHESFVVINIYPEHKQNKDGGKRVSPGVLACLGSTMASIKALDHANAHLLLLYPDDVRAANKQRWCTQA